MPQPPNPTTVLRIATLAAQLPLADPRALARVSAVATRPDADDSLRGIWAFRELDWLPLFAYFGRTRGWHSAKVRSFTPEAVLDLLAEDLAKGLHSEQAA